MIHCMDGFEVGGLVLPYHLEATLRPPQFENFKKFSNHNLITI